MIKSKTGRIILHFALPLLLAAVILTIIQLKFPKNEEVKKQYHQVKTIANVFENKKIEQSFTAYTNGLAGIGIKIEAKSQKKEAKDVMQCTVLDGNGEIVAQQVINSSKIKNDKYTAILFKPVSNSKNQKYTVQLIPVTKEGSKDIVLYKGNLEDQAQKIMIDGYLNNGSLVFSQIYKTSGISTLYIGRDANQITSILALSIISVTILSFLIFNFARLNDI